MRATPPLYVLIWEDRADGERTAEVFDHIDHACAALDEAYGDMQCIGAAAVFEVTVQVRGERRIEQRWTPFNIGAEYRRWLDDKKVEANERDRLRMETRRAQMP